MHRVEYRTEKRPDRVKNTKKARNFFVLKTT